MMETLLGLVSNLRRRWRYWRNAERYADELRAELETHRAMVQADLEDRGLSSAEAAARSGRALGNVTLAREDARDVWAVAVIDRLWRDARYGVRALRREPTLALTAIVTLALGVATITTIFSVADAELWKPLPFPDPERLVAVRSVAPGGRGSTESISGVELLRWTAESRSFANLAGVGDTRRRVLQLETAHSVLAESVTWNYLTTLGRTPLLGRTFVAADEGKVAVMTERAWRRVLDADAGALGRDVLIDGQTIRIVGVVPTDDSLGPDPDLFLPIDQSGREFHDHTARTINLAVGRLHPGIDPAGAQAEMQTVVARAVREGGDPRTSRIVEVHDLKTYFSGSNWRTLYFFLGASVLLLILTCVNVASLLVARALRRAREFAIRGALGGGTAALVRQLAVEGVLLAVPGGALALLLTHFALRLLAAEVPPDYLLRGNVIPLDMRVGAFAIAVTCSTAIAFAILPAFTARRVDLNTTLGAGARTAGSSPQQSTARRLLLTAEIAITVVLLAGAGLFVKSYAALLQVPLGFETNERIALRVTLSGARYASDEQILAYASQLLDRARALPGVRDGAVGTSSPLNSGALVRFTAADQPPSEPGDEPRAIIRATTPEFFRVLGIGLMRGRPFAATDAVGAPRVVIINEVLASRLFPGQDPIGRALTLLPGARAPWTRRPGPLTIVGVVNNVKEIGVNEVAFNDLYVPFAQMPAPGIELIVHAAVPPAALTDALRAAAAGIDTSLPVGSATPLTGRVTGALQQDRLHLLLIGWFAAVALALAGIGVYGGVAYAAQQRRREFGVRLALGARPGSIVVVALRESIRVGLSGGVIGIALSLLSARLLGSALYLVPGEHNGLLYGVRTTDPVVLAGALLGIVAVALLAGAIPARGVARLDPLAALRQE